MKKLFAAVLTLCLMAATRAAAFAKLSGTDNGGEGIRIDFSSGGQKVGSVFAEGSVTTVIVLAVLVLLVVAVCAAVAYRRKKNTAKAAEPEEEKENSK